MLLRQLISEWVCGQCSAEPCVCESHHFDEGVMTVFGKSGNKVVRKYRCTSGSRKGRVVAKAATCNAPKNVKASNTLKRTRRSKGSALDIKRSRTNRSTVASQRVRKANISAKRHSATTRNTAGKRRRKIRK